MLFFGLLFFIFLQVIRPQDFVPGLVGVRLVLYTMPLLLVGLLFSPIKKKIFLSPQDKFAGLFICSWAFSMLSTYWLTGIIDEIIDATKILLIYYFLVLTINSEEKFKIAVWTTIMFMFIVGLMGIFQFYGYNITGARMMFLPHKGGVWAINGIGMFDNPNHLAYSIILVIPFALGFLFQTKNFVGRLFGLSFLSLAIYCVYLTRSRGGQIALAACLFSWLYFWTSNPKLKRFMIILAVGGVLAVISAKATGYREDESAMGRIDAWSAGWDMLKNNLITGVGKGNFTEEYKIDSHNSFVRAASELGLVGLYSFVGMIYAVGLTIKRLQEISLDEEWRVYSCGFGSFFVSYVVGSLLATKTYDVIFLMCVAFVGALGRFSLTGTAAVDAEGVLFPEETAHVFNKTIFGLTTAVLVVWYLFLRQVW